MVEESEKDFENDQEYQQLVKKRKESHATGPLSLEEIHRKHKQINEEQSKPKFISQAEREREALKRRQNEIEEKKKKSLTIKKSFQEYLTSHLRKNDTIPENDTKFDSKMLDREFLEKEAMKDREIKKRYLGYTNVQKKKRKTGERKFNFDWEVEDDTSKDYNDLYSNKHHIQLFGRGRMAGYDLDMQKEKVAKIYLDKMNTQQQSGLEKDILKEAQSSRLQIANQWADLPWREKPLSGMTARDWRILKEDFDITTKGGSIPNPLRYWNECPQINEEILNLLLENDFHEPTSIQRQAIPIALNNRDVIGVAETGSGKTLAFLIPLINWLLKLSNEDRSNCAEDGPFSIILAPTRELVLQIYQVLSQFGGPLKIKSTFITGGTYKEVQSLRIKIGVEIIVATPGRLLDMIKNNFIVLAQCVYVVLDEADKMIDLGFEPEIQQILESLPVSNMKPDNEIAEDSEMMMSNFLSKNRYRQTFMFSATMPPSVERLARKYLRGPAIVYIGVAGQPTKRVEQVVFMIKENEKRERLMKILQTELTPPIIIFVNQKRGADVLAKSLDKLGFKAVSLHGGKIQDFREGAIDDIKQGHKDILVATDVAGRGLDIKDVTLVINYDMPKNIDAYVHRIGRTGRAGQKGTAISFVTEENKEILYDLRKMIEDSPVSTVPRELAKHPDAQVKPGSFASLTVASGD